MVLLAFAESIQLFPDGTLFIHIALILLMIWVLNRTFFKPINAIIERRSRQKSGRGGEAAGILDEVSQKQKQYEKMMLEARSKTYELIERERSEAVAARDSAIAKARAEVSQLIDAEREAAEKMKADAKIEIALEAHKIAERITANILKA